MEQEKISNIDKKYAFYKLLLNERAWLEGRKNYLENCIDCEDEELALPFGNEQSVENIKKFKTEIEAIKELMRALELISF